MNENRVGIPQTDEIYGFTLDLFYMGRIEANEQRFWKRKVDDEKEAERRRRKGGVGKMRERKKEERKEIENQEAKKKNI